MRFKHVMSCIKSDTLGLKGVYLSVTKHRKTLHCLHRHVANVEYSLHILIDSVITDQWLVWSFANSLETSVGRLPNRLDVRVGVGEDTQERLLEVAVGMFTRHKDGLTWQLPCICHGSADDPKENATGPFSTFVFDAV
ncbi:hypothetical protein T01_12245 [Trichinella spiralis]|uniref:Uncharacterized protein n=1 Tax=Trichinella spiralis TaxID=6334 RepID=A0A0V1AZZ8_TRISP|nr:hypothetical protein T01_12245 [Trichinella spiralis]